MTMTDLPLVSMLRTRMHWQQARQKVLAENVANADTPGFAPRDLRQPSTGAQAVSPVRLEQTSPLHLIGTGSLPSEDVRAAERFETHPSGNAVDLENEMLKVSQNQADYQLATSLYTKSLGMLRMAAGSKS